MPRSSLDRSQYYRNYYQLHKELIRNRYYEKKEQLKREEELYAPYGGVKNYYKQRMIDNGWLIVTNK